MENAPSNSISFMVNGWRVRDVLELPPPPPPVVDDDDELLMILLCVRARMCGRGVRHSVLRICAKSVGTYVRYSHVRCGAVCELQRCAMRMSICSGGCGWMGVCKCVCSHGLELRGAYADGVPRGNGIWG